MPKNKRAGRIICPLSRLRCVECPIYRGRHYYICEEKDWSRSNKEFVPEDLSQFSILVEATLGKKVIRNVEELIERSEL